MSQESLNWRDRPRILAPKAARRPKILYVRDIDSTSPAVFKLLCSVCHRTDFSSVHALLNHARSKHRIDWGSHDECIRNCSVRVVDQQEIDVILQDGLEVASTSLPSVRGLFERALGVPTPHSQRSLSSPAKEQHLPHLLPDVLLASQTKVSFTATTGEARQVLSILGHHEDTPTLAPFLGRAPRPRRIKAHQEESTVDVNPDDTPQLATKCRRWYMPFNGRSGIAPAPMTDTASDPRPPSFEHDERVGEVVALPDSPLKRSFEHDSHPPSLINSRFHFTARVVIVDHSLRMQTSTCSNFMCTCCVNSTLR